MNMGVADYFKGMEDAKSMGGGQYVKGEGKFVVVPKRMWVNKGHKGKFFITEFEVTESSSDLNPPGCTRSWTAPLEGERAARALGDIKNLIFALTGQEPKDVGEPAENPALHREATKIAMAIVDEEFAKANKIDPELFIGEPIRLETNEKPTKKGGTFTVHTWSPFAA